MPRTRIRPVSNSAPLFKNVSVLVLLCNQSQDYGDARAMWSSDAKERVRYSVRKLKDRGLSLDLELVCKHVQVPAKGADVGRVDWQDKWEVQRAVAVDGLLLQNACARLQGNKDVVLAAVEQNGTAIKHASLPLQQDRDVALAAVAQSWRALGSLPQALRDDKALALLAVAQDGNACAALSHRLCGDRDVLELAVTCGGAFALKFATQALKADKLLVLAAVRVDGLALEHAAKALQADDDVCRAALDQNPAARAFCAKAPSGTGRRLLESLFDTVANQISGDPNADPVVANDGMTLQQVLTYQILNNNQVKWLYFALLDFAYLSFFCQLGAGVCRGARRQGDGVGGGGFERFSGAVCVAAAAQGLRRRPRGSGPNLAGFWAPPARVSRRPCARARGGDAGCARSLRASAPHPEKRQRRGPGRARGWRAAGAAARVQSVARRQGGGAVRRATRRPRPRVCVLAAPSRRRRVHCRRARKP